MVPTPDGTGYRMVRLTARYFDAMTRRYRRRNLKQRTLADINSNGFERVRGKTAEEIAAAAEANAGKQEQHAECQRHCWNNARASSEGGFHAAMSSFLRRVREVALELGHTSEPLFILGGGRWSKPHSDVKQPTVKVQHWLSRRAVVVVVGEYNTSKMCSMCGNELHDAPGVSRHRHYGVKRCSTCRAHLKSGAEVDRLVDRDVNACCNMLQLFHWSLRQGDEPRPPHLRRNDDDDDVGNGSDSDSDSDEHDDRHNNNNRRQRSRRRNTNTNRRHRHNTKRKRHDDSEVRVVVARLLCCIPQVCLCPWVCCSTQPSSDDDYSGPSSPALLQRSRSTRQCTQSQRVYCTDDPVCLQ